MIQQSDWNDHDRGDLHRLADAMCQPAGFSAKELQLSAEVAPQTGRKPWQGWRGLILLLFLALSTSSSQCSDPPCSCQTLAYLHLVGMAGNILNFSISNAPPGSKYDLYFRNSFVGDNWRFRRVCSGIQVDTDGQASFQLRKPDPQQGIFVLLDAGDDDGDGLPNGYECFFTYNGNYTSCDSGDSDNDGLQDAWEVEYGLNPTKPLGPDSGPPYDPDGGKADPDSDGRDNANEQQSYYAGGPNSWDASYDPLRNPAQPDSQSPYGGPNRPVITISADSDASPQIASFTLTRDLGIGASLSNAPDLTVYYSLGGDLNYSTGDFSLYPSPPEWPRICSAVIKAGQASVAVIAQLAPKIVLEFRALK